MTVLRHLTKLRHPNIIRKLRAIRPNRWTCVIGTTNNSAFYVTPDGELSISLLYGNSPRKEYLFTIYKTSFDLTVSLLQPNGKLSEQPFTVPGLSCEHVSEEVLFQHSLINSLGMFGTQEYQAVIEFCNSYWMKNEPKT